MVITVIHGKNHDLGYNRTLLCGISRDDKDFVFLFKSNNRKLKMTGDFFITKGKVGKIEYNNIRSM